MPLEHLEFIARILVQPDLADAEHRGPFEKLRDDPDNLLRKLRVLGLLRVDAQPAKMRQPKLRRALRLVVGELAEVVVEAVDGRAVEARPEGRLAHGGAPGGDHVLIVVSRAADHVAVRFDVAHRS